ncbi:UPF0280 family protein [Methanobrevibacter sp. DSM 116169]|uniref:UPF0280 family protein n=1 Tax=Methanobrevibacter sp. DSM 116169 TaxID=3242727 RepID=UPI0038FC4B85
MYKKELINLNETKISLKTDLTSYNLRDYVQLLRNDINNYIKNNSQFLSSLKPININSNLPIIDLMCEASKIADVGPIATVAGSIAEMSCEYLINLGSNYSIVDNGGDIALINDEKVVCGIYSGNEYLNTSIGFKLKSRKKPIGICTSSGKVGLSISFGSSESVTAISKKASYADGLATSIANAVNGTTSEDAINNAILKAEKYKDYFEGVLIIKEDKVATIGKLPEMISTNDFDIDY